MKFNRKLGEPFWRILYFPSQRDKELHLHAREAFQRWPPRDMTCLKETLAYLQKQITLFLCFYWVSCMFSYFYLMKITQLLLD